MKDETYWQLLKRPEWQQLRLRRLEAAGWECTQCGDKGQTLHVHHRQYFKGRKPWEYEHEQLIVLCEDCHKGEHQTLEELKDLLSRIDTTTNAAVLAGFNYNNDWLDPGVLYGLSEGDRHAHAAGFIARLFMGVHPKNGPKVLGALVSALGEDSEEWHLARKGRYIVEEMP